VVKVRLKNGTIASVNEEYARRLFSCGEATILPEAKRKKAPPGKSAKAVTADEPETEDA
jgi:hypothetical protein